jgi:hypothetical protein
VSVLKYKRKESKFEVFDYFYRTRKEITDLLLRDFGYDKAKSDARIQKYFGGRTFEELNEQENSFRSWIGSNYKLMSHIQIQNIRELYVALFGKEIKWKKSQLNYLMEQNWKTLK